MTAKELAFSNIRKAVRYVERTLGVPHPLAREQFKTDGVDLFTEKLGTLISASREGQVAIREVLEGYLERVEARWMAGDDIEVLASDHEVEAGKIQEALRATAAAA